MPNDKETLKEHKETRKFREDVDITSPHFGEIRSTCTCGATWTHPKSRSEVVMDGVFQSHIAYFNRPSTIVL